MAGELPDIQNLTKRIEDADEWIQTLTRELRAYMPRLREIVPENDIVSLGRSYGDYHSQVTIETRDGQHFTGEGKTLEIAEDDLHLDVLRAIAAGAENAAQLAAEAARTADIEFSRWCA